MMRHSFEWFLFYTKYLAVYLAAFYTQKEDGKMEFDSIFVRLGLDTSEFDSGIARAISNGALFESSFVTLASGITIAAYVIGSVLSVY